MVNSGLIDGKHWQILAEIGEIGCAVQQNEARTPGGRGMARRNQT